MSIPVTLSPGSHAAAPAAGGDQERIRQLLGPALLQMLTAGRRGALVIDESTATVVFANHSAALLLNRPVGTLPGTPTAALGLPGERTDWITHRFCWPVPGAARPVTVDVEVGRFTDPGTGTSYRLERYLDCVAPSPQNEERSDLNELLLSRLQELDAAHGALARAYRHTTGVREQERRRLAVGLHDDTIQRLVAATWHLDELDLSDGVDAGERHAHVDQIRTELEDAIGSIRTVISDLYPATLNTYGLIGAIERQAAAILADGTACTVTQHGGAGQPPADVQSLLYRIATQALRNVGLHAHARRVEVDVTAHDDAIRLVVRDDGVGFRPGNARDRRMRGHIGIDSMREEVALAGGLFTIGNRTDGRSGTKVSCTIPFRPEQQTLMDLPETG